MSMTESAIMERLDSLTRAAVNLARVRGTRLTRTDMCSRLGVCGKTLAEHVRAGEAPAPFMDGKWLLWRVLEWDIDHASLANAEAGAVESEDNGATDDPGFHLYRHFDAAGVLLYVGVSINALTRLAAHKQHAHWFWRIAKVEVTNWKTREASLQAEKKAIQTERPLFNITHRARRAA